MRRNISTHFHHIGCPNPLVAIIDKETERAQRRHPRIRRFSIVVEKSDKKRHKCNQVRAQVIINLPKKKIVVSKEAEGMTEDDNAAIALIHAFAAAERAVDEHVKKSRLAGSRIAFSDSQPTEGTESHPVF